MSPLNHSAKFDLLVINACQKTRNSFLSKNIAFVVTHFSFPIYLT